MQEQVPLYIIRVAQLLADWCWWLCTVSSLKFDFIFISIPIFFFIMKDYLKKKQETSTHGHNRNVKSVNHDVIVIDLYTVLNIVCT
jgi:hypothetical protein